MFALLLLLAAASVSASSDTFSCEDVPISSLAAYVPSARAARICYNPSSSSSSSSSPLHIFAHGDGGGGPNIKGYDRYNQALVAAGYISVSYMSCWVDQPCGPKGSLDALEIFKTGAALKAGDTPEIAKFTSLIDWATPISVSGHSSGARAVLIAAAMRDGPDTFMHQFDEVRDLNAANREIRDSIGAVIANHPDMMYDPAYNPDIENYNISKTPTLIITGSKDVFIEEPGSAWHDFTMMPHLKDKIFVNIEHAQHSEIILRHRGAPITVAFADFYARGISERGPVLFEGVMEVPIADDDATNNGEDGVGSYLACGPEGIVFPSTPSNINACRP